MRIAINTPRIVVILGICLSLSWLLSPLQGLSQPHVKWISGPKTVDLGWNVAEVKIWKDCAFLGAGSTKKLMRYIGNPTTGNEVGLIAPMSENVPWYLVFEYYSVGHIADNEKNNIDSESLLEEITRATEAANEERREKGHPTLTVKGWYEKPHYNDRSNNLVWALRAEGKEGNIVNYNVRILGRKGYVSAILVTDTAVFELYKPLINNLIRGFSFKEGKGYTDYRKGDKVAGHGLTALIAGGATATAAKSGLLKSLMKFLARAWKIVVVAVLGFLAAAWRIFKGMFVGDESGDGVIEASPIDPNLVGDLSEARYLKNQEHFKEALKAINAVLKQEPNLPDALLLKAQILQEGFNNSGAAKGYLEKVLKLTDPNESHHIAAKDHLEDISQQEPGHPS